MSSPKLTVPILREMAKEAKIKGYSKMVKAELEQALGITITGKPRGSKASPVATVEKHETHMKPVAKATHVKQETHYDQNDCIVLFIVGDAGQYDMYLLAMADIPDFEKLKAQIRLPVDQREVMVSGRDENYIDDITTKFGKYLGDVEAEGYGDVDIKDGGRVVYTAVVLD